MKQGMPGGSVLPRPVNACQLGIWLIDALPASRYLSSP
jgi:hypothetical protein